ncbi:hypothetical protein DYY67_0493 [Candidatus Nitrosotalea sp. TS]|nr:hypothetical protein [Candidatus Nitrosotalea sp. TS]
MHLSAFFKLVKVVNQIASSERMVSSISSMVLPVFDQMLDILGLKISQVSPEEKMKINGLINQRNPVTKSKKFSGCRYH